jgi:hypothetical protein
MNHDNGWRQRRRRHLLLRFPPLLNTSASLASSSSESAAGSALFDSSPETCLRECLNEALEPLEGGTCRALEPPRAAPPLALPPLAPPPLELPLLGTPPLALPLLGAAAPVAPNPLSSKPAAVSGKCRSAQSILQLYLSMLLSYAQHLCSILQHMHGSHESMRRMMVEKRLVYLLENAYKLFLLLSYLSLQSPLHLQTVLSTLI